MNGEGGIVYAENTDVEFEPSDSREIEGKATVVKGDRSGWKPVLFVTHRQNLPVSIDLHIRSRGGFTLFGADETGRSFTWYIGAAADRVLVDRKLGGNYEADAPLILPPELEDFRRQLAEADPGEGIDVNPLVVVDEEGVAEFSAPTQILFTRLKSKRPVAHVRSLTGLEGNYPELFVLSEEDTAEGWILIGVDGRGKTYNWYLDGAAEAYLEVLE